MGKTDLDSSTSSFHLYFTYGGFERCTAVNRELTLVYRKKFLKYTIEVYDRFLCFLGWGIRFCHRFSSISSRFCCIESGYFFISIEIKNFIFWKKWIFIKSMIVSYVFWGEEFDYLIQFYSACLDFA